MNSHAATSLLSTTAILGISASVFILIATDSSTTGITVCALTSLSIAGMAWVLDRQLPEIAKNPSSLFTKEITNPKTQSENQPSMPLAAT